MTSHTHTHVFEEAYLGNAPFKYDHYEHIIYQACPGAPVQPGGSCDYCGQAISDAFFIQSADGKLFKVGSSCVAKTGDRGLYNRVKREAGRIKREQQVERDKVRIANAEELLDEIPIRHALSRKPHEQKWAANKGLTMLDWVEWMFANAGHSGSIKTARYIEKISKEGN